jgi:hypothetical protein
LPVRRKSPRKNVADSGKSAINKVTPKDPKRKLDYVDATQNIKKKKK